MAAVRITTMACEPNTAYKAQREPNFHDICPCTKNIEQPRFENFISDFSVRFNERCEGFRALRT